MIMTNLPVLKLWLRLHCHPRVETNLLAVLALYHIACGNINRRLKYSMGGESVNTLNAIFLDQAGGGKPLRFLGLLVAVEAGVNPGLGYCPP